MTNIILSQKSVFYLNQLSNVISKRAQRRFRLNDEGGIRELLAYASVINDEYVSPCHKNFVESLDDAEREYLFTNMPPQRAEYLSVARAS